MKTVEKTTISANDRAGFSIFVPRYRGEIWENTATVPMGRGYANDGQPFDIETACYLKPVQRAIKDPDIPVVAALAAVQMLKTFGCIEEPLAYFIQHDPADTTVYIGGDDSSRDQARSRIIPRLRSIPGVAAELERAEQSDRWDVATQEFYLAGQVIRIWGLNENTTARMTLRRVMGSDLYLSKSSGLWLQAMARTTQHRQRKIIGESQGGEEGDDMDKFWHTTDMGMLHVACPICGERQPFDFHREREPDFKICAPFTIPTLDRPAWEEHHRPIFLSAERKNCGFKRGDDDLIKRADGTYNESEILKQTHYECYHCGGLWHDTPRTRLDLDRSSHYVPSNPNALPGYKGFSWPSWAGQRLRWGGEEVMLGYLRAKQQHEKFGNIEPLKQWFQKRAARPWNQNIARPVAAVISGSYEVKDKIADEVCRVMFVDCQQDDGLTATVGKSVMGKFWWDARAIDKAGNIFQISRGWGALDEWQAEQKRLEISNENVGIDGGNWRHEVIDLAAKHIAPYQRRIRKHGRWRIETIWHTYTVLVGNGKRSAWRWPDGRSRSVSQMQPQSRNVTIKGQRLDIRVPLYEWSNLSVKDQLSELMRGADNRIKFESLARSQISPSAQAKEVGNLTYENQMSAEYRTEKRGAPYWEKSRPDNHYFDCAAGCLVLLGLGGYLGIAAAPEQATPADV